MSKAIKTNEQLIKGLLKDLHTIEVALLRERIQVISDITRTKISENPKAFDNPFVSHEAYISLCDKIDKHLATQD